MTAETTRSASGKALIRSLNRRGSKSDKSPPVARKAPALADPTICDRCGAVYSRKTWRQGRNLSGVLIARAKWSTCPGCTQASQAEYYGRLLLRGAGIAADIEGIRARIRNVANRAAATQPERRIVSQEWDGATMEVLTTSQKLAHRIAHELEKAFGGKATYSWSDDDGSLFATWQHPGRTAKSAARGKLHRSH